MSWSRVSRGVLERSRVAGVLSGSPTLPCVSFFFKVVLDMPISLNRLNVFVAPAVAINCVIVRHGDCAASPVLWF